MRLSNSNNNIPTLTGLKRKRSESLSSSNKNIKTENKISIDTNVKKSSVTKKEKEDNSRGQDFTMQKFIEDYNKIMNTGSKDNNIDIKEIIEYDLHNIFDMLDEMEKQSLCTSKFIDYCNRFKLDVEKLLKTVSIERENMKVFVSNSIRYWSSFESDNKKRRKYFKPNYSSSSSSSSNNNNNQNNNNQNNNNSLLPKEEQSSSQQLPIFNDIKKNITHIDITNINESITTQSTNIFLSTIY